MSELRNRGRRVPAAAAQPIRSEPHLDQVRAFMREVDATAREYPDTRGAVLVIIEEPVYIVYVPYERLASPVPPNLLQVVAEYDMAKEYVVIALVRRKAPPLEYRVVQLHDRPTPNQES